jgi:DNA-binding transcriptional MerR regulator
MSESELRRPLDVMNELGISATTLRRWSKEFARFLSPTAAEPTAETGTQQLVRRYTEQDVKILARIKALLSQGYTYEHVEQQLDALATSVEGNQQLEHGLVRRQEEFGIHPAVKILSETLHTVAESQQAILNIQQSTRDLMGVVIQDNFNLKAENAKLRDRMLELERELSELRRHSEQDRRALEERLRFLELQLAAARALPQKADGQEPSSEVPMPAPYDQKTQKRKGFWSRLTGE